MKTVLVTQRVDVTERKETRDSLDQKLVAFILAAGGLPVPVPNALGQGNELRAWVENVHPAALVLSGGNDIGEREDRDSAEYALLEIAKENILPVLGICRGMQLMSIWAGGELRRVDGHVRTRHELAGLICGSANSYHEYALAACPPDFDLLATDENGSIEAICHRSLPWEAWMWHPEREAEFDSRDVSRLRNLLN